MKLFTCLAALLTIASCDPIHTTQSTDHYANNAEIYQSELEVQQQGVYGDQYNQNQYQFAQNHDGFAQSHDGFAQNLGAAPNGFSHNQIGISQNAQGFQRPSIEKSARILRYENENKVNNYQYAYETENGIKVHERGQSQGKGIRAQGGYSYTGDDGQVYSVTYTADENGFRAQGAHLPTPPPIPEAIQKSIEQNARDQANGVTYDDGSYKELSHLNQVPQVQNVQQFHNGQDYQSQYQGQEYQAIQDYHTQPGQEPIQYQTPGYQPEIAATTAGYHFE